MSQPADLPPGARCTQPGCDRPATDADEPAGLCPEHHPTHETDTEDETEDPTEPTAAGEQYPDHPGTGDLDPMETVTFSGAVRYPDALKARDWWVTWVLARPPEDRDGEDAKPTKQPVAPYMHSGRVFPCRWNSGLDEDEHPATAFSDASRWSGWATRDFPTHGRVVSDELGLGIIIPTDQDPADDLAATPDSDKPVTLIDWDDVRDPETGEIHPAAGWALAASDCYAEISQSGEGIHQFVYGEVPGGLKKFIRHVDSEPFVGDDRPAVEIYESGRLTAMTGRHVAGSGEDVTDGQELLDRLCWMYGTADNNSPGTPTDPFRGDRGTDTDAAVPDTNNTPDGPVPDHETVAQHIRESQEFGGTDPEMWDVPAGRSLEYEAVLRARERSEDLAGVANWELIGYAAALGHRDGLTKDEIRADLQAHPTPQYGYDEQRARSEVSTIWRKIEADNHTPPTRRRLIERGILPETVPDDRTRLVVLPDPDELRPSGPSETPEMPDESALPGYGDLSPRDAQNRTQAALARAIGRQDDALIEALPTMGKTYAAGRAPTLVEGETPVTVVTQRGRNEQYAELCEHAADAGLSLGTAPGEPDGDVYVLPSFKQDCPTANGDHGEDWADLVGEWYDAGAPPRKIHAHGGREAGTEDDNLPCQRDGCEYARLWDFDPDEFELLIGHPLHLAKPKVAGDRTVLVDEYPGGAFETTLAGPHLRGAITRYLREFDGLPFDSFGALAMGRTDSDRRADALAFLEDRGVEPDGLGAIRFDDSQKHALAPLAVYTMLATADSGALGNGFARTELPDGGVGVFEFNHGPDDEPAVHILRRPDALAFGGTNVIGLDGTPTPYLWEVATGCELTHRVVLEDRRAEYVEHALGHRIVQTSEYTRPYYNPENINTDRDAALLQAIRHRHGEAPGVITTSTGFIGWDRDDLIDLDTDPDPWEAAGGPVGEILKYGNMLGSNRFGTTRVGAVLGSQHYGDGFIGKWAAYAGEAATLGTDARGQDEQGRMTELDYGETGNRIHEHMKRATLQAMFRFGRDGNGATVYVDSDVLPDWVPVHGHGDVTTLSGGLGEIVTALEGLGERTTTAEIVEHEAVTITKSGVHNRLSKLQELGAVVTQQDPEDGRRHVHTLADNAGVTASGVVTLPDAGGANGGRGSCSKPYSSTIGNTANKSDSPETADEPAPAAAEDSGESCGRSPYSTTIGNSTSKSDSPETADEPAPAAAEDSGESCGRSPYSKTIGNTSAKPDGGTPSEEADTPTDEQDEPAALDYPAMAAEPDDGTDWELTRRVVGPPDAEDGGG